MKHKMTIESLDYLEGTVVISRGLAMITMTRYTGDVPKALPSMLSANAPQVTDRRGPFD